MSLPARMGSRQVEHQFQKEAITALVLTTVPRDFWLAARQALPASWRRLIPTRSQHSPERRVLRGRIKEQWSGLG